jgi:hypothetical protein
LALESLPYHFTAQNRLNAPQCLRILTRADASKTWPPKAPPSPPTQAPRDWYTALPSTSPPQLTPPQIPSVPRPDQKDPSTAFAHADPAHAADNTFDIPRGVNDRGPTGEATTGTGDQLPTSIEKKNLDDAGYNAQAKGHDRFAKHARAQQSEFDPKSGQVHGGHGVQAAPGEELATQEELLEKRGAQ